MGGGWCIWWQGPGQVGDTGGWVSGCECEGEISKVDKLQDLGEGKL